MLNDIFKKSENVFLHTYTRLQLDISRGEGVFLYDKNGNKYLDFFAGLAVNALGYAHPGIIEAVSRQISRFGHLSNNFITDIQVEFGEMLVKYSMMSKVFLTNSGTEAVEAAIKLIRKKYGPDLMIYSLTNSFHGRTYGALSLMGREKYKKGFEPFIINTGRINFNDVEDLTEKVGKNTAAVFLEFIQGEGGINPVSKKFIEKLEELRKRYKFAVVSDGIQCGTGRTGKPYSHNLYDFEPDIIVTAKAIGGGLPLGAMLVKKELEDVFSVGSHGTTFGGNPVSCAAGKVVLEEVYEKDLMRNAGILGEYFKSQLHELQNLFPEKIKQIRGNGLMLGIEFFEPCNNLVIEMRKRHILINCTNEKVIRLLPPLIVTKDNIDLFMFELKETLKSGLSK